MFALSRGGRVKSYLRRWNRMPVRPESTKRAWRNPLGGRPVRAVAKSGSHAAQVYETRHDASSHEGSPKICFEVQGLHGTVRRDGGRTGKNSRCAQERDDSRSRKQRLAHYTTCMGRDDYRRAGRYPPYATNVGTEVKSPNNIQLMLLTMTHNRASQVRQTSPRATIAT